jgi:hypothetical protein
LYQSKRGGNSEGERISGSDGEGEPPGERDGDAVGDGEGEPPGERDGDAVGDGEGELVDEDEGEPPGEDEGVVEGTGNAEGGGGARGFRGSVGSPRGRSGTFADGADGVATGSGFGGITVLNVTDRLNSCPAPLVTLSVRVSLDGC